MTSASSASSASWEHFPHKTENLFYINNKAAAYHPHKQKFRRNWLFWSSSSPKVATKCVRTNAWLLSYKRSTNVNVTTSCSEKSVDEWIGITTCQQIPEKDQSYVKVGGNDVHDYIKAVKLWVRLKCFSFQVNSEFTFDELRKADTANIWK